MILQSPHPRREVKSPRCTSDVQTSESEGGQKAGLQRTPRGVPNGGCKSHHVEAVTAEDTSMLSGPAPSAKVQRQAKALPCGQGQGSRMQLCPHHLSPLLPASSGSQPEIHWCSLLDKFSHSARVRLVPTNGTWTSPQTTGKCPKAVVLGSQETTDFSTIASLKGAILLWTRSSGSACNPSCLGG
jgi:hypothetical protein